MRPVVGPSLALVASPGKQLMWYRRDDRIEWFNALAPDLDDRVVARVLTALTTDEED